MGKLGGGALGAKRILRGALEDMELPKYRRAAPTKRSP
jgi:hypothetical protein